uniref:ComF family protein n=1 Tax=Candidatus Kentrum sp. TC TaxID=2126339 RepID=A0A450ZNP6_9GAMM|nr:MAG: comF family protein [Candidatus Kentron sp. TC]VFK43921.1 MAG: comF family protein [Candidatus Kentron sp. TC]VFK55351.1 MAG: comF family protein [Candidatus Kentron sp. TC]
MWRLFREQLVKKTSILLIPTNCLLCGAVVTGRKPNLCAACRRDLPKIPAACPVCGVSIPESRICPACLRREQPFTRTYAAFQYTAPISYLVALMKFRGDLAAAQALSNLLADHLIAVDAPKPDLIIPVPLHAGRLRERGFNQAIELSREIANRWGIPVRKDLVSRQRATPPQTGLPNRAARRRNVRKAFALRAPVSSMKHAAILDDVMTSGATVTEVARLVAGNGVSRVDVWCCCRAGA